VRVTVAPSLVFLGLGMDPDHKYSTTYCEAKERQIKRRVDAGMLAGLDVPQLAHTPQPEHGTLSGAEVARRTHRCE